MVTVCTVGATADTAAMWDAACRRLPAADAYFTRGYHAAHEAAGDGTPTAFIYDDGHGLFFYPFMLRRISAVGEVAITRSLFDIETVYGYSGPLSTTNDPRFLREAWAGFADYCRSASIVAEFARCHPYAANQGLLGPGSTVVFDRQTVSIDLSGDDEEFWARYPQGQRAKIRQARDRGLMVTAREPGEGLSLFRDIYRTTMKHVGAREYYFFCDAYFDALESGLGDSLRVFAVDMAGVTIAAAVFLWSNGLLHYHLGGSLPDARDARPNNLLFHEVAQWGRSHGCHALHLGGGRTPRPDDELLRFKATFSKDRRGFHTGRRVHDVSAFDELNARWLEQARCDSRPDYFLLYRMPIPTRMEAAGA